MNDIYKYLLSFGLSAVVLGVVVYFSLEAFIKKEFDLAYKNLESKITLLFEKRKIIFSKVFEEKLEFLKKIYKNIVFIEKKLKDLNSTLQNIKEESGEKIGSDSF